MSLEEVEKGDDPDGLKTGPEDGPVLPQDGLLRLRDPPHLGKLKMGWNDHYIDATK